MKQAGAYNKTQFEQAKLRGQMRRNAERALIQTLSIKGQLLIGTWLSSGEFQA